MGNVLFRRKAPGSPKSPSRFGLSFSKSFGKSFGRSVGRTGVTAANVDEALDAALDRAPRTQARRRWRQLQLVLAAVDELQRLLRERRTIVPTEEVSPEQFFQRLLLKEPADADVTFANAMLAMADGAYDVASELLRTTTRIDLRNASARYHLSVCLLLLDPELERHASDVEHNLEQVVELTKAGVDADNSMRARATILLGHLAIAKGDFRRAATLHEEAIGVDGVEALADVHFQRAFSAFATQQVESAARYLDCSAGLEPLTAADAVGLQGMLHWPDLSIGMEHNTVVSA